MTSKASQSLPLRREGIVAFERGNLELAEKKFEEALKFNDTDVETNRYYGETLWRRGKRFEAMVALRNAAGKHGAVDAETSLYRSLGEKSLALDDPKEALVWANKAVDLSPKSVACWELRGKVYRSLGRPHDALLDFQRAAHFSVDDRELLRQIATLQNELHDYDSGLATWQCLERLYPTNHEPAAIFAGKGDSYIGLGLYTEAETAFAVAVRYDPDVPDYRVKLAETALIRGNYEQALASLDHASSEVETDPALQSLRRFALERLEQIAREDTTNSIIR